ncbi:neuroblast differentiation-associated protein AHNAK isoform X26 [Syngnathus acus]|uniref:neuroblast differentiation-associated protein AHNAK isoform X26 n=1 Tax=Syngnathus acus TaxID=161584 RepID=UPI001885DD48|nr:neuroblast differentiation-associated protein AHNAK isoform X26 [Syngnathus acus]
MDPETFDEQTDQTPAKAAEPPVEIMVETEAEAGASGYSVTGGGERGIFIKDVLKDSPAAKHLSLQQGDQLLSAKVYFDNVRYEDALKILQCAEPYKVSFLVKRTIQGEDVYLRPRLPSVDIKVPNTKMAKMSVKAIKPFKAKKKRGGRFGLRRLKEKRREELVIEGTPPRLDISDVDVEFCLPKFKHRQSGHLEADGDSAAKAKRKIRFPGMKIKGQSGGKEDTGRLEAKVKVSPAEIPAAKVKAKGKAPKFGINFPKSKDAKSGSVELKKPGVNIASPSFEFSLPAGKGVEVEMGGASLNSPDVEFALPSIQADASLPAEKGKVEIKGPKVDVRRADAKVSMGKVDVETGKGDGKLQMPKLKLPKMRLSRHLDEKDDKMKVKAEGEISVPTVEIKGGSGIVVPEVNVTKGNVPSLPSVDISLPKVKGTSGMDVKTSIKKPGMDFSVPDVDLHVGRIPDEVEGTFKGPGISMPTLDISLPKMGSSNLDVDGAESRGKFSLPSAEIGVDMSRYIGGDGTFSLPSFDVSQSQKAHLKGPDVKGEFKMPSVDLTLPKGKDVDLNVPSISLPEGNVKLKGPEFKAGRMEMPDIDVSLPKGKLEGGVELQGPDIQGGKFKMPSLDVSLPKVNLPEGGVKLKGPEFKGAKMDMPDIDVSLPKGKLEGGVELQGPDVKGGKFKMPTLDVSLPKVNLPEGGVKLKGPEFKGAKMDMPDIDVSFPKGKLEGGVQLQGPDVKGGKFKMPSLDISLPKVNLPEGGVKLKGPKISGGKTGMADLDVSFPKGKVEGEIGFEGHVGKEGKFHMPAVDISLPKVKTKAPEINIEGPDVKGVKVTLPTVDVSLPKVEGDLDLEGPDVRGGKFKIPTWDISLPKVNLPEGGLRMKGPELKGGKMEIPDMDVSLPKGKVEGDVDFEGPDLKGGKLKMPKIDVSLPKVNLPEGNVKLKGPEFKGAKMDMPDIDVSLPKGKAEGEMRIEGHVDKGGKFHMPSVDISLPKMKAKGPHINIEEHEIKGGKVTMPTVDVSLPTIKSPEVDFSLEGPDVKGGKRGAVKLPTVDISAPKVDLDFGLTKPKGDDVEVALLKAEGSRPSSGGSFDLPHVSLKAPSFTLPRFGGKSKSGRLEVSGQSSEGDISLKAPSVELGLDSTVKGKKAKLKTPSFGISPTDADVSVSCPEFDVNTKKGGIAIPKPDVDVEGKGHFHAPDVTIKFPKFSMPGKPSGDLEAKAKARMPSVELSLPATKSPEMEVLLPKAEVDVSQCDIQTYEGHLKIPKKPGIDVTVPKVDLDVPLPKIKLESSSERGAKFKMPDVDLSLPKGKIGSLPKSKSLKMEAPEVELKMQSIDVSLPKPPEADVHGDGRGTFKTPRADIDLPEATMPKADISMKMPRLDITGPKGDLELDLRLRKGDTKVDVSDVETNSKVRGPKVKGTKFNIGMPKKKNGGGVKVEVSGLASTNHNGHKEGNVNVQMPGVALPSAGVKSQEGSAERGLPSSSSAVPRIPDIDFDIGTAQDEDEDKLGKRIKIPKFGVPLPSLSSPEGRLELCGSEIKQEGPKIKKAVFVLVNPPQTDNVTLNTGDVKVKTSKFQTKTMETSVSTTGTSVWASPVKTEDPMSRFHFEKDSRPHKVFKSEDVAASGKVKLPKVEFTSPYGKKAAGDANFEMATRLGKPSLSGEAPKGLQIKPGKVSFEGFAEESSREVVSHHSRTERLDQDTFGSPAAFTMGFSSTKVQTWSEGDTIEDPQGTEAPSWFKVPKVTLKPHSTGFLQITPEGSPQAQRRGELGGEANLSGSFCQQSSDDVTTREVSSPRGGGSVTVVTKTTRTKQHSTPAGTSAGHWLGTTHPPSDL